MAIQSIRAAVAAGLGAWLVACGGGGGESAGSPGVAMIGAAGGTAIGGDGAQVVFPRDALRNETTVRIAKDSTGAPPLPPAATAAGAVYTITPHGEAFAVHAEVSIPVEITEIADNQQLLLVSAGIGRFSPDFEFNQRTGLQYSDAHLQAKLTFPAQPAQAFRVGAPRPPPTRACMPISLGHNGAAWRFFRDGTQALTDASHYPILQGAEGDYPSVPTEIYFSGWSASFTSNAMSGFGAVHVYGQDTPRRGAFAPAGSADVWALPPAGNSAFNDQLMWHGFLSFDGERHNGRMRIDTTIATDCNLLLEAVPISFQLNLASRIPAWVPYNGVQALYSPISVPNGMIAVLPFAEEFAGTTLSIAWEYSHDAENWEEIPVPAQHIRNLQTLPPVARGLLLSRP